MSKELRPYFGFFSISNSRSSHNEDYESVSGSGSASFSGWGFEGSASASYSSVENSVRSSDFANSETVSGTSSGSATSSSEQSQKTDFNPNFLQIRQITTTTLTIKGVSTIMEELEYVDSIPVEESLSRIELRNMGEDEIKYLYGDIPGVIRRNTYEKCGHYNFYLANSTLLNLI